MAVVSSSAAGGGGRDSSGRAALNRRVRIKHNVFSLTCASNDGCSAELAVAVLEAVKEAIHDRALLRHDARTS